MNTLGAENICGSNFGYWNFSFESCLNDVAELGLKKFDLWGIAPHFHVDHVDSSDIAAMKQCLNERDLELRVFTPEQCVYPVNIASESDFLRSESVKFFKRSAELCAELDCPNLFVICGWGMHDKSKGEAWKRSVASMQEIVDYAHSLGVGCITETLKPSETNLTVTAQDLADYLDDVASPHLKVCVDTVAMAVSGETPADHFKLFGEKIVHCHFVDGNPKGHLAWGDGELPLDQYIREFADGGYSGLFMPEISSVQYRYEPKSALIKSVAGLTKALS